MKRILLSIIAICGLFIFLSCSKTSTCICKDSSGNVISESSESSSMPGGLAEFESDCIQSGSSCDLIKD